MKNILLITINFKNTSLTKKLIQSIELSITEKIDLKIIIIDNLSSKSTRSELNKISKESPLNIELSFNKENLFYWPAFKKYYKKTLK